MNSHEVMMKRCLELATLAGKNVGGNPNVGAVLVYKDRIIGEGYYKSYGGPHAEVNCLNDVKNEERHLIPESILYVSLEPCCIHGKTPPCSQAIMDAGIKQVVVGTTDPNPAMSGKSLILLKAAGIKVIQGVLENECEACIKPFSTWISEDRPYITLKLVKSSDNYLGIKGKQTWLSNEYTSVLTHKWRDENHGILAGSETIKVDNPALTTRNYPGDSPRRIIIDRRGRLHADYRVFNGNNYLYIGTASHIKSPTNSITLDTPIEKILTILKEEGIFRLLVEGGAATIQSFLDSGLWDEARVITVKGALGAGIKAPNIHGKLYKKMALKDNDVQWIYR